MAALSWVLHWWQELELGDRVLVSLVLLPGPAVVGCGYVIFGVGALLGWYPEGGWLRG